MRTVGLHFELDLSLAQKLGPESLECVMGPP